jgi:transcription antitermination factor NusG
MRIGVQTEVSAAVIPGAGGTSAAGSLLAAEKDQTSAMLERVSSSIADSLPWYALKVRSRAELSAASMLDAKGYKTICPTYTERKKYSDRTKSVQTVVFPGYLFCRFDVQKKVPVISNPFVQYIVALDGVPTPIGDREIKNIQRAVLAGARPVPYYTSGQRVRVLSGPLAGIEGIVVREGDYDRLIVSIELLNRSVALQVSRENISLVA